MKRSGRAVNGFLVLDKPVGLSSNQALQQVKTIFSARKAGHTGTLDVLASGVLPICFGEATKFSQYLLDADKRYLVMFKLGQRTTTCDAEGEVIEEKSIDHVTNEKLQSVLKKYHGEIQQIPSMYSAIKHKGKPLYQLARQGIEVERKSRTVTIHELNFLGRQGAQAMIDVCCSKGTYIRTLVDDIGQALQCGAYVSMLRRSQAGPFEASHQVPLEELKEKHEEGGWETLDSLILPIDFGLSHLPAIQLTSRQVQSLYYGQPVHLNNAALEKVRFLEKSHCFIGVGSILENGRVEVKRLFSQRA